MTKSELHFCRLFVEGNRNLLTKRVRELLQSDQVQAHRAAVSECLRKLDAAERNFHIPEKLRPILVAKDEEDFPVDRFLLRDNERRAVEGLVNACRASAELENLGIRYTPTLLLHGPSGTGKTMLAEYLAYTLDVPYVYVRFSALIGPLLGETGSRLSQAFSFAKEQPCVLCLDEVDTIATKRGVDGSSGEMNRVVIGLMQEMDALNNSTVVVATTNRLHDLDDAFLRRCTMTAEVAPLLPEDSKKIGELFFTHAKREMPDDLRITLGVTGMTAAKATQLCTKRLVADIVADGRDQDPRTIFNGEALCSPEDLSPYTRQKVRLVVSRYFDSLGLKGQLFYSESERLSCLTIRHLAKHQEDIGIFDAYADEEAQMRYIACVAATNLT